MTMKDIWANLGCQVPPQTIASLITFITHLTESDKRMKRVDGDLVTVLAEPLRKLLTLAPMAKFAGQQWVYYIGGERKIVGDFDAHGALIFKTLYGRGNPVDKRRKSVVINDL